MNKIAMRNVLLLLFCFMGSIVIACAQGNKLQHPEWSPGMKYILENTFLEIIGRDQIVSKYVSPIGGAASQIYTIYTVLNELSTIVPNMHCRKWTPAKNYCFDQNDLSTKQQPFSKIIKGDVDQLKKILEHLEYYDELLSNPETSNKDIKEIERQVKAKLDRIKLILSGYSEETIALLNESANQAGKNIPGLNKIKTATSKLQQAPKRDDWHYDFREIEVIRSTGKSTNSMFEKCEATLSDGSMSWKCVSKKDTVQDFDLDVNIDWHFSTHGERKPAPGELFKIVTKGKISGHSNCCDLRAGIRAWIEPSYGHKFYPSGLTFANTQLPKISDAGVLMHDSTLSGTHENQHDFEIDLPKAPSGLNLFIGGPYKTLIRYRLEPVPPE